MIIISNHPSLLEPVILPLIGFPWMNFPWLFSPLWFRVRFSSLWVKELLKLFTLQKKLIPVNVPDKNNFYDPTYLRLLQGSNIPVDRNGGPHGRMSTVSALRKILENGGRVLIFPEGTRTFKATEKSGVGSPNRIRLGKLKDGAAWLALKTSAKILPVWVEGTDKVLPNNQFPFPRFWHRMTISIGHPFIIRGTTRQEATLEISQSLLALASEQR